MKMLSRAMKALGMTDVEKRDGVYVSRPVLNGQDWHDWAKKWGVPEPLAPDDFHVTVVYSLTDVKMMPDPTVFSVYTGPGYSDAACFCLMGPENNVLTVAFAHWGLWDRNWAFIQNGAVSRWPTYRPHMTITKDVKAFELSDDALADAPIYIHLGGEVFANLKGDTDPGDEKPDAPEDAADDDGDLIVIVEVQASAAAAELTKALGDHTYSALDLLALRDIQAQKKVERGVLKRIAGAKWAPEVLKMMDPSTKVDPPEKKKVEGKTHTEEEHVTKRVEKEFTLTVAPLPADIAKALNGFEREITKAEDEEQVVFAIASVATIKGQPVIDLQGDEITAQALREFNRSLLSGTRSMRDEHGDEDIGEIVAGLVLSDEWQKSLGIDLGYEPYLVELHLHKAEDWKAMKTKDWEFSIRGTMWEEVEA